MNFQAVRNAQGQYVTITATLMNVVIKQGNYGQQADCTVTDNANETQVITCSLPKPPKQGLLPSPQHIGQTLSFYIKVKPYGNKTFYNGFWNSTAKVNQHQSQPAQNLLPAGISEKELRDIRCMCVAYAKDLAVAGKIEVDYINSRADEFKQYIETGSIATQPDPLADDNPFPPEN